MPRILITGNGFDLSFGLPTGYSEFIRICNKLISLTEFQWSMIKDDIKILKESSNLPSTNFPDFEEFQNKIKGNTWYKYLSREYSIETWIDFEKHIEKALTVLHLNLEEIRLNTFLKSGRINKDTNLRYQKNLQIIDYVSYLTLLDFKIIHLSNPTSTFTWINPTYFKLIDDYYVDFESNKLFDIVLKELNIFRDIFSEYLQTIVLPLYDLIGFDNKKVLLQRIDHHFTFNYTPSFSKLVSSKIPTTFLHGDLKSNNIVLGINDWGNVDKDAPNFIPFTKYFQKLNFNIDLKFVREVNSEDDLYQFFFWGHSLDKSDALYINEVFDMVGETRDNKFQR
ncbi:AbiH family protein [Sphingobacterium sp. SG20118]|uniref:AbiH family protein n=1 Tax=Sphingobacterium sp. SG20118 TaxID=3367156 RepID=UPI0037DFC98D